MGDFIQIFFLIICGMIFIWVGHWLFFGPMSPVYPYLPWSKRKGSIRGRPGDPQICPVCSIVMLRGELVKTIAYATGVRGKDYLVHVKGCYSCLENDLPRCCPICKHKMSVNDYLVARMFDRPNKKNHMHVLGCNHCRKA